MLSIREFWSRTLDTVVSFLKNEVTSNDKKLCILPGMQNLGTSHLFILTFLLLISGSCYRVHASGLEQDSTKVKGLLDLADKHSRNQPDSAIYYARQAVIGAKEIGSKKFEGFGLQTVARILMTQGKLDEAIPIQQEVVEIFEDLKHIPYIASIREDLGRVHQLQGNYPAALKSYHLAKSYYSGINDSAGLSLTYNRLGSIYSNLKQYDKAIEYHKLSLSLNLPRNFKRGISANWNNISGTYQYMGIYDSALVYVEKALEMKLTLNDKTGQVRVYTNMGVIHTNIGNFEKGEDYLRIALGMAKKLSLRKEEVDLYINLCYNYLDRGQTEKAIEYGNMALKILEKENFPHSKLFANKKMAQAYSKAGNYKKAYDHLRSYILLSDSLLPDDLALQMVESEAKLEAEKQQAEIELLQSRDSLNQFELQVQERQKYWILALLVLTAILATVLFSRYRLKLRTNQQLQSLDEVKSRFFANLSHEFRTPLTLIIGPLEKLIKEEHSNGHHQDYERILRNANHLLNLNEQLLDLARIESGTLKVNLVQGDVVTFLEPVAESFRILAEQKQLKFKIDLKGRGIERDFDSDKLEKVLNNLLSNAIKYTPEGGEIHVQIDAGESLRIEVNDTGDGIHPSDLDKIFDRYFRLEHHLDANVKGAGIGLSLTRELVELMGGTITVESEEGIGSRFLILLPMLTATKTVKSPTPEPIQIISSAQGDQEGHQQPLLLIVDDNTDIRTFVREQFENTYQIIEAENGQLGLESALATLPDIVITDLMMPVMDGIELCRALRSDIKTSHIPVIMLTALATVESKIEGLETGADDYVNKPFNAQELSVRVRNLIEQRRLLRKRFAGKNNEQGKDSPGLPSAEKVFLNKVEAYIQDHIIDSKLTVEHLGEALNMSRVQLFRKLKAISGQSPSQMIRVIRLRKAAELLASGTSNVAEAMYGSGFDNPSYFAKVFRTEYGCSPSEYKEKALSS